MSLQNPSALEVSSITDCLMAHVDATDAIRISPVTDRPGGGMIVTGKDAMTVIRHLRATGYDAPLLPDRQRYSGRRRVNGTHPFDQDWLTSQQRIGCPVVVPDAGYIPDGDLKALQSVLRRSAEVTRGIALLALSTWWIHTVGLDLLLTELAGYTTPVALILEHTANPLDPQRNLSGVLQLINSGVRLLPLRSDQHALGLIAFGAVTAAIGARSGLRHLYPIKRGGGPRPTGEATFWPAGLSFHGRDLLYDAVSASPHEAVWLCHCRICNGKALDRLLDATDHEVREHNHACLLQLRDRLAALSPGARPDQWREWCAGAVEAHIAVGTGPVSIPTPRALLNWLRH